mgnify:CR=1 FL=1
MTEVTHGRMWRIAGPIVLSNATVPLLGAVDTGVVGQLGQAAPIGAVGLGAVILATLYWVFGFLRMGTSGLAAQAQGAGDGAERAAVLMRALIVGLAAGLGLIVLQVALVAGAFTLAPASAEVEALTRQYLAIRIWGAPATIALYAVTGWLVGVDRHLNNNLRLGIGYNFTDFSDDLTQLDFTHEGWFLNFVGTY